MGQVTRGRISYYLSNGENAGTMFDRFCACLSPLLVELVALSFSHFYTHFTKYAKRGQVFEANFYRYFYLYIFFIHNPFICCFIRGTMIDALLESQRLLFCSMFTELSFRSCRTNNGCRRQRDVYKAKGYPIYSFVKVTSQVSVYDATSTGISSR